MKFKKHAIILIILLFITFIFLFIYFISKNFTTSYQLSDENKLLFGKTIRTGDINGCNNYPEKIESIFGSLTYPKGACYSAFAEKNNDAKVCDMITEKKAKITCIYNLARTKKDLNVCNLLPQYNIIRYHDCLASLAYQLKNSDICNEIEFEKERNNCIKTANSIEDAQTISDEEIKTKTDKCEYRQCIHDIIVENKRPDLCSLLPDISDDLDFKYDYFSCITNIAERNNSAICENLKTEKQINRCYYYSTITDFQIVSDM